MNRDAFDMISSCAGFDLKLATTTHTILSDEFYRRKFVRVQDFAFFQIQLKGCSAINFVADLFHKDELIRPFIKHTYLQGHLSAVLASSNPCGLNEIDVR